MYLCWHLWIIIRFVIIRLKPNDPYMGRTAPLTSKRCILYIYSTNIGTEHFKHALYSPVFFFSKCSLFHNANLFGSCIIHILYTGCAKIKKIIPAPKGYVKSCIILYFVSLVLFFTRVPVTTTRKEESLVTDETGIFVKKWLRTDRSTVQQFVSSDWEIPHQP